MIEFLILIAAVGSVLAGAWDLKTTEVPDEVPALMIPLGMFFLFVQASIKGDFYPLFLSLTIGTAILAIGLAMYKKGEWGGADAWIFASIAYVVPLYNGRIFMVDFIFNFLAVSVVYMVAYSLILGVMNPYVFSRFLGELKKRWKIAAGVPALFFVVAGYIAATRGVGVASISFLVPFLLVVFLMIFWTYAKAIEQHVFRKKIPVDKLKAGDVLEDMVWRGITEEEVKKIRKEKKFVTIKEGVRFVPVFPITLVVTLLYGNVLLMVAGL